MPYSTVPDLLTSYPRLSSTQANSATLSMWLSRASNYIDGYIASVVPTVPVTPAPPILKEFSEDLAQLMYLRRNVHEAGKDDGINNAWKEMLNRLENMRNGSFVILSGSGTQISLINRDAEPWSDVSGFTPTFSVLDIEDAHVDPDREYEEWNKR